MGAHSPHHDSRGVPVCSVRCSQHDGKRCRLTGFEPDRICEPAVIEMVARLRALPPGDAGEKESE